MPGKRNADEALLEDLSGVMSPASKRSRLDSHEFQPEESVAPPTPSAVTDNSNDEANDDEPMDTAPLRQSAPTAGYDDLYLDTINRNVLDFDFEKLCSVTLSNINVYACLVCGKYFQGRGPKSHAYFHALDEDHHVFINMRTQKVYVLPEGYEVTSKSLDDIKFVSSPHYQRSEVAMLDRKPATSWTYGGDKAYTPGFVGMNNIKQNDYVNVVVQALSHVPPLRNFFLLEDVCRRSELVQRYSLLVRKIWNPRAFKAHVSPHELLQEIALRSNKRFTQTTQADPVEFMSWFLNNLHLGLGGSKTKPGSSVVQQAFQGRVKVESQAISARADASDRLRFEEAAEVKMDIVRFLLLTLDLPPAPLFQDELEKNIIPQVPLTTILKKYNGVMAQEQLAHRKRYRLLHPLPPYLIFHIKRFSQNKFVSERNPTIVTFEEQGLDVSPFVEPDATHPPSKPIYYDLVANIVHEAVRAKDDVADSGEEMKTWKVQVKDRGRGEWTVCQDLFVDKVQSELLFSGESYLQIWERRREPAKQR
ncbi:putative mRNA-splicing protein ubp10 [Ceratocystis lukuohia]|uniref:mRNA-splicing protein ubp10 n=2 Tax=Ceratocystis TaxID=5157 RepID=A0ABR4MHT5_9PEZI|nr:putative mRNA-splicing protein ubp10 [Ceratocystis fimbriata CBS 114723]